MICKLNPGLTWDGILVEEMNIRELKLILAYKLFELRAAVSIMSEAQIEQVNLVMKSVHVPVVVREKQGA